jgi:hypothetical protein
MGKPSDTILPELGSGTDRQGTSRQAPADKHRQTSAPVLHHATCTPCRSTAAGPGWSMVQAQQRHARRAPTGHAVRGAVYYTAQRQCAMQCKFSSCAVQPSTFSQKHFQPSTFSQALSAKHFQPSTFSQALSARVSRAGPRTLYVDCVRSCRRQSRQCTVHQCAMQHTSNTHASNTYQSTSGLPYRVTPVTPTSRHRASGWGVASAAGWARA